MNETRRNLNAIEQLLMIGYAESCQLAAGVIARGVSELTCRLWCLEEPGGVVVTNAEVLVVADSLRVSVPTIRVLVGMKAWTFFTWFVAKRELYGRKCIR